MTKKVLKGVGLGKDEIRQEIKKVIIEMKERFILLFSGRGVGKTYTCIKEITDECVHNGREFCLVTATEADQKKGALKAWVKKVYNEQFRGTMFKYTAEALYFRFSEDDDWTRLAICVPLSKVIQEWKKRTGDGVLVDYMIMDEALIEDYSKMDAYLDLFLTLYDTFDRRENRIKALFFGNTLNKLNPVFEFFKVTVDDLKKQGTEGRNVNQYFWYIPTPPDLEEEDNAFAAMIKGTKYGEMAAGYFDINYGYLVREPKKDAETFFAYGVKFGDSCAALLYSMNDGFEYFEACPESHMQKYASSIFVTTMKQATEKTPLAPAWFRDHIQKSFANGVGKFIDEESLLVLSPKMRAAFAINVL